MKFLVLLLLSFNLYAQDESCVALKESTLSSNINKLLEWFGALDNQIEKAPCKVKSPPTEAEMLKFISSKTKSAPTFSSVYGVNFKNESPELIAAFKAFTTAKDSYGLYELIPNQKQIAKEYKIGAECDKVLCAMEKIWGREYSVKLLYMKLKHNFNSSELAFENADRFSNSEFNDVLVGLEDLPPSLIPLGAGNQPLTHFKRGYTLKQYSNTTLANAVVMIFDPWDKKSNLTRQYTLFHEMSHNVSSKLRDMDESPEWLNMSGWVKKGDDWSSSPSACQVSQYGTTNPWEDFAETLSAFRYNGVQLRNKCPQKFDFVKNKVFKGIDYTDVKNCTTVPMEKIQLARKSITDEIMNSVGMSKFEDKELNETCDKSFTSYPIPGKELAVCSLKLHSLKALSGENRAIAKALAAAGIPDTTANRDLVLSDIASNFTDEMMTDISLRSIGIQDQVEEMVKKSFVDANPQGFSKKDVKADDYRFRSSLKECGAGFFTGKLDEVKECQLKAMINKDRDFQRWDMGLFPAYKSPSIFTAEANGLTEKREAALYEHISKQPLSDEAIAIEKKSFTDDLRYHAYVQKTKFDKLPDWKKMSPESFCKETYGSGSSWTEQYGAAAGIQIPKIYDSCVTEQAKKSKRFEFKEDAWMLLVR